MQVVWTHGVGIEKNPDLVQEKMLYSLDAAAGAGVYLVLVFMKEFCKGTIKTQDKATRRIHK